MLEKHFKEEELGHAAAVETSPNLYLHGGYVNMDNAADEKPRELPTDGVAFYPEFTHDKTHNGVFGVSRTSAKEKGAEVFKIAVEKLIELIGKLMASIS